MDIRFIYSRDVPSILVTPQLLSELADEQAMDGFVETFALLKTDEILDYAKEHFKGDPYLKPDSTTLTNDFVNLYISFDDGEYKMGESYLDTTYVALHYTDQVGEMGSILDNILAICTRTDRGFAFVYKGKKKNTNHRLEWNRERARWAAEYCAKRIWQKDMKTNQVRTAVWRERSK